jgi:hypothetical protein
LEFAANVVANQLETPFRLETRPYPTPAPSNTPA